MCGFLVTNRQCSDHLEITKTQARRGPDLTTCVVLLGAMFVHHLLSVTGAVTSQPFVRGRRACVFNGEIYNHAEFGQFASDGECILPAHEQLGDERFAKFDGEFAICMIEDATLTCVTDPFGTKPIWYALEDGEFGVASYASTLRGLGFNYPTRMTPNTRMTVPIKHHSRKQVSSVFEFNTRQYKATYDKCIDSFVEAVKKRSRSSRGIPFIGLSGGYDSGAIAAALLDIGVDFQSYSVVGKENTRVVRHRLELVPSHTHVKLSHRQYEYYRKLLGQLGEDCIVTDTILPDYNYKEDSAAVGLASICNMASKDGHRVYLSGHGADEILSDYGMHGRKLLPHSQFAGIFPRSLDDIFPWHSFNSGTMIHYSIKDELTAGIFGIETRYPFLDKQFVQEFLWLSHRQKNRQYKAPLHAYLLREGFPFAADEKAGFTIVPGKAILT